MLLAANADVNATASFDQTALQAAARGGYLEVVEKFLAANADVNATANFDNRTVLQEAAREGHLEVVEKLEKSEAEDGL